MMEQEFPEIKSAIIQRFCRHGLPVLCEKCWDDLGKLLEELERYKKEVDALNAANLAYRDDIAGLKKLLWRGAGSLKPLLDAIRELLLHQEEGMPMCDVCIDLKQVLAAELQRWA